MVRRELTEQQRERLRPPLPPQKPHTGRPNNDHRRVLEGIVWARRTGAPWAAGPARSGSWKTVASRCCRGQRAGIRDRLLTGLQALADADGAFDWTRHFVDSTTIRAHQHAAGAKRGIHEPRPAAAAGAGSAPRSTS